MNANDLQALTYIAKPSVRVYHSATQALSNSTATNVVFDTDVYDRWGMHNTSTNTNRLTVQVPGIYIISASLEFAVNATGQRAYSILQFNSSDVERTNLAGGSVDAPAAVLGTRMATVTTSLVADVGDYFVLDAFQNSGGDLDITAATAALQLFCSFAATWHSRG